MSSFHAAAILTERGMAVDALTLVRGIYENALWLGFLMRAPAEAVDALAVDEWRSQRGRDKALLTQVTRAGSPDLVIKGRLEARVADADLALKGKPRLADGDYQGCAQILEPVAAEVVRIGGSGSARDHRRYVDRRPDAQRRICPGSRPSGAPLAPQTLAT